MENTTSLQLFSGNTVHSILYNMADEATDDVGRLLLSDDEKRVLELHDRLQKLQLEIALITAQKNHVQSMEFDFLLLTCFAGVC